jgi:predicted GH43/DUF377 family glycosyl hydrolase
VSASTSPNTSILMDPNQPNLRADSSRLLLRLFVAGLEEVGAGDSRAGSVIQRLLALTPVQISDSLADLDAQYPHSLTHVHAAARKHGQQVSSRVDQYVSLTEAHQLLIGAAFTHQYAVEGAALCNPSIVMNPNQDPAVREAGGASFILSVRGIGEGHHSSIGFRTMTISVDGVVAIDTCADDLTTGDHIAGVHHRAALHELLQSVGDDHLNAAFVLETLPPTFDEVALEQRLALLEGEAATMRNTSQTVKHFREFARSSYGVRFAADSAISDRILWPVAPVERQGMEDARFVRFTHDDGTVTFYATYTGFDGRNISQQLLETADFESFLMTPMAGNTAIGKGLALFPRKIGGRYVALSRSDRESNSIVFSDELRCWNDSVSLQTPIETWEILQLGNCGSPIETPEGWLVLTHGVGPMRTYAIGALLLDLDDPTNVLGRSSEPLIQPRVDRGGGYVPNVVYTCGAAQRSVDRAIWRKRPQHYVCRVGHEGRVC